MKIASDYNAGKKIQKISDLASCTYFFLQGYRHIQYFLNARLVGLLSYKMSAIYQMF